MPNGEPTRINPAEIPAMFRRLGIRPMLRAYTAKVADENAWKWPQVERGEGETVCLACLVGLVASAKRGFAETVEALDLEWSSARRVGLSPLYAQGLSDGWEGQAGWQVSESYLLGHEDGRAAYKACVEEGMVIVS